MLQTTISSARASSMRFSSSTSTIRSSLLHSRIPSGAPIRSFTQRSTPKPRTPKSKSSPGKGFTFSSTARPTSPSNILQRLRKLNTRFLHATKARRNKKSTDATPEPTTLSGKMKKLTREYGWSVVLVYGLLSAADYPFCFLLVRSVGVERIGHYEHIVTSNVAKIIPESVKTFWTEWRAAMKKTEVEMTGDQKISDGVEMAGWGVEEAEQKNNAEASLGTQLALAYAIHKSFIFIRIPLTVAVLPRFVKLVRGWGWDIGKRTSKETKAINRTIRQVPKASKPGRFSRFRRASKPNVPPKSNT